MSVRRQAAKAAVRVVDVSVREKLELSFLDCGGSRGEEG